MNETSHFPWLKSFKKRLTDSFPEVHSDTFSVFHNNVHEEYVNLLKSPKKSKLKSFYALVRDFYYHICWKINWKKEHHHLSNCVVLLFYLSQAALILSKGNVYSTWFDQIFMILKSFPGDPFLVCDVLLLMKNVKKKHYQAYAEILKSVLFDGNVKEPSDVECFIKVLLLFRRFKLLTATETPCPETDDFMSGIKPPPGLEHWLSSLDVAEFQNIKRKKFVRKILRNGFQGKCMEKLYHVLLDDKYDKKLIDFKEVCQECVSRPKPKKKKHMEINSKKKTKASSKPCRLDDENTTQECEAFISHQKIIDTSLNATAESSEALHNRFPNETEEEICTLQNNQYSLVLDSECKDVPLSETLNPQKKKSKKRHISQTVNSNEPSSDNSPTNHQKKKKRNVSDTVKTNSETNSLEFLSQAGLTQNSNGFQKSMIWDKLSPCSSEFINEIRDGSTGFDDSNKCSNHKITDDKDCLLQGSRNLVDNSNYKSPLKEQKNSKNDVNDSYIGCKYDSAQSNSPLKVLETFDSKNTDIQNTLNSVNNDCSVRDQIISYKTIEVIESNTLINDIDSEIQNSALNNYLSQNSVTNNHAVCLKNKSSLIAATNCTENGKISHFDKSKHVYCNCERNGNITVCSCKIPSEQPSSFNHVTKVGSVPNSTNIELSTVQSSVMEWSDACNKDLLKEGNLTTCVINQSLPKIARNASRNSCFQNDAEKRLENVDLFVSPFKSQDLGNCLSSSESLDLSVSRVSSVPNDNLELSKSIYTTSDSSACAVKRGSPKNPRKTKRNVKPKKYISSSDGSGCESDAHDTLTHVKCKKDKVVKDSDRQTSMTNLQVNSKKHNDKSNVSSNKSNIISKMEIKKKREKIFKSKEYIEESDSSSCESDILKDKAISDFDGQTRLNNRLVESNEHSEKPETEFTRKIEERFKSKEYIEESDSSSCESSILEDKTINDSDGQTRLENRLVESNEHNEKPDVAISKSNASTETEICKERGERVQSEPIECSNNSRESSIIKNKEVIATKESISPSKQDADLSNNVATSSICKSPSISMQRQNSQQPVVLKEMVVVLQDCFKASNNVNSTLQSSTLGTVPSNEDIDDNGLHPDQKLTTLSKRIEKTLKSGKISKNKSISTEYSPSKCKLNSVNPSHSELSDESASENASDSDHESYPPSESSPVRRRKQNEFIIYSASEDNSFHSASASGETDSDDFINDDSEEEDSSDRKSDSLFQTSSPIKNSKNFNSKNFVLISESEDDSNISAVSLRQPPTKQHGKGKRFKNYLLTSESDDDNNDLKTETQNKIERNFIKNDSSISIHEECVKDKVASNIKVKRKISSKKTNKKADEVKCRKINSESDPDLVEELSICSNTSKAKYSVVRNTRKKLKLDHNSSKESIENSSKSAETSDHISNKNLRSKKKDSTKEILSPSKDSSLSKCSEVSNSSQNKNTRSKQRVNAKEVSLNSEKESCSSNPEMLNDIQNKSSGSIDRVNVEEIMSSSEVSDKSSISSKRVNARKITCGSENSEISNSIKNKPSRSKKRVNAKRICSSKDSESIQNTSTRSNEKVIAKEVPCGLENQSSEISSNIQNKSLLSKKGVDTKKETCSLENLPNSKHPEVSSKSRSKSPRLKRSVNIKNNSCVSDNQSSVGNPDSNLKTKKHNLDNSPPSENTMSTSSDNQSFSVNHPEKMTLRNRQNLSKVIPSSSPETAVSNKNKQVKETIAKEVISTACENQLCSNISLDGNLGAKQSHGLQNSSSSKGIKKISANKRSLSINNSRRSTLRKRQNINQEIPSSAAESVSSNEKSQSKELSSVEIACESQPNSNVSANPYSLRKSHDTNNRESTTTLKSDSLYCIPLSELQKRIKSNLYSSLHFTDLANINQLGLSDSSNNVVECGENLNLPKVNQHSCVVSDTNNDHSVKNNFKGCTLENVAHSKNVEAPKSKHESNLNRQNSVTTKNHPTRNVNNCLHHSASSDKILNKDSSIDPNCLFDENFFLTCLDKIDTNMLANPEYLNSCIDDYLNSTNENAIINNVEKNRSSSNVCSNGIVQNDNAVSCSKCQTNERASKSLVNTSGFQCHEDNENSRKNHTVALNSVVIENGHTRAGQNSSLEISDSDQFSTHLFFNGNNSKNSGKIGCEISLGKNTSNTRNSSIQKDSSYNSDNVLMACSEQNSRVCSQFQVANKSSDPSLSEIDFRKSLANKMNSTPNSESLLIAEQQRQSATPVNFSQSILNVSGLDAILNTENDLITNNKQATSEKILFICDVEKKVCEIRVMPPNSSITISNNKSANESDDQVPCSSNTDCGCSFCKSPSSIMHSCHKDKRSENVSESIIYTSTGNVSKNRKKVHASAIPVIDLGQRCNCAENNLNDSTSTVCNESLIPVVDLGQRCNCTENNLNDSTSTVCNESLMKENDSSIKSSPQNVESENPNQKNIFRNEKNISDNKDSSAVANEGKKGYNLRDRSRQKKWPPY